MLYRLLWIFFIYAFLGWCTEVSYAALVTGSFVNRGFLNGPVCPIYGFGVVIVLTCLTPLAGSLPLLFLGSVVLTSALEWLTGFALEKLFHQRWWDYSDEPFNLSGYICLRFAIAWGFACMFVVKLLHPTVLLFIRIVPQVLGVVLLALMGAVMAVDLAATVSTFRLAERRAELADNLAEWEQHREEQRTQVRQQLEDWHTSMQALLAGDSFGHRRLLRAFPRLRSLDHAGALERLHHRMEHLRNR